MKPATLVSIGCLATACWIGSVSPAEACSCSPPETLVARDRSFAVFEGTVVDQRITLIPGLRILAPEQDIVVGRVWKGEVTNQVSVHTEHGCARRLKSRDGLVLHGRRGASRLRQCSSACHRRRRAGAREARAADRDVRR